MRLRGLPRHPVGDDPHSIMSNAADPRRSAILTPAGTGGSIEASGDGRLQASARLASTGSGTSGAGGDGGGSAASGGAASARAPCGVEKGDQSAEFHEVSPAPARAARLWPRGGWNGDTLSSAQAHAPPPRPRRGSNGDTLSWLRSALPGSPPRCFVPRGEARGELRKREARPKDVQMVGRGLRSAPRPRPAPWRAWSRASSAAWNALRRAWSRASSAAWGALGRCALALAGGGSRT